MRSTRRTPSRCLVLSAAQSLTLLTACVLGLALPNMASAATGTWAAGNSGTWDITATNWSGVAGTPWDSTNGPTNTALFAAVGDVATINGSVYAGTSPLGIQFAESANINRVSTGDIRFQTNTSAMTIDVSSTKTGTINAPFFGGGTGNSGNVINKTGGGTLVLTGDNVLVDPGNLNTTGGGNATSARFTVAGSSTLTISGMFKAAGAQQSGNSSGDNEIGTSDASNTVNINGTVGKSVMGGSLFIGNSAFGSNSVYITRPGSLSAPSYLMVGNGEQLVQGTSSSSNYLEISNGAAWRHSAGGGTNTYRLGVNAGANSNSILITGAGSVMDRSGAAGSTIDVGLAGNSNSLTVSAGGRLLTRRLAIGTNGGDGNFVTTTGAGSQVRIDNNNFFIGTLAGSDGNYNSVEAGGNFAFFNNGGNFSIGQVAGVDNNYFRVTGTNSIAQVTHDRPISVGGSATGGGVFTDGGATSNGNHFDVYSGGLLNTTSTVSIYLGADTSSFNLGNGTGISTATVGASASYTSGVFMNGAATGAAVNFNSGRLIANANGALISGTGTVTLNGPAYLSTSQAGSTLGAGATIVALVGGGSLIKEGTGTLTTSGSNTYSGATTVKSGTLTLDYATNDNSKLANGAVLTLGGLGGGTVNLSGGTHTEVVGSTTLDAGASSVTRAAGTATLAMGAIMRNSGATIGFGAASIATTTTGNDASGFLGPWTSLGTGAATTYATNDGGGNVVAYTGGTAAAAINSVTAAGTNYDYTATGTDTLTSSRTGNTLRYTNTGVTIDLNGNTLTLNGLMNANSVSGSPTIQDTLGGGSVIAGSSGELIVHNADAVFPITISAPISSGALIKTGVGPLTLSGANTYTGLTRISAGTLQYGASNVIGTGGVTVDGGQLALGFNSDTVGAVTLSAGSITGVGALTSTSGFTLNGDGPTSIGAPLAGSVGLTKSGVGTATLSGASTYSGTTTVTDGALKAGVASVANVSGAFGNNSPVVMGGSGLAFLDITGFNTQIGSLTGGSTGGGQVLLGAATLTVGGDNTSPAPYAGIISGTGALTKIGTGTLTLTGHNTYSGASTISAGIVNVRSQNALGSTAAGTTVASGATLQIQGSSVAGEALTLSGTGAAGQNGALVNVSGNNAYGGVITLGSDATISSDSGTLAIGNMMVASASNILDGTGAGFDLTLTGAGNGYVNSRITGSGTNLTKNGLGTWYLTGALNNNFNNYTGTTTVNAGTLIVSTHTGGGAYTIGSTATLGGTGAITPAGSAGITALSGSFIAPGASIDWLTMDFGSTSGGLTMAAGSSFLFELGVPNASIGTIEAGSSDMILISGASALDVAFNSNNINFLGTGSTTGFYKLFDTSFDENTWFGLTTGAATTGGNIITGGLTATNLGGSLAGTLILADGSDGTSAGDIYLSVTEGGGGGPAVPEPSTLALAALGLAGLGLIAWRRRRRGL